MNHSLRRMGSPDRFRPGIREYAAFLPASLRSDIDAEPISEFWTWRDCRVRLLRRPNSAAATRIIVVHGAGAHGEALWPLVSLLPESDFDLTALDLPLYGDTVVSDPCGVRYDDWVHLLQDFVASENDQRPLLLLGASIGGMLAYEVAATTNDVDQVVVTCLLDPRDGRARSVMTRFGVFGRWSAPLLRLMHPALARRRVAISRIAPISKMSRDPGLSLLCASDPRGGGGRVTLGFLASLMSYRHAAPERMTVPVTLAHPERDGWTPIEISQRWLSRIAAPANLVLLRDSGHFPVEERGLRDLIATVSRLRSGT